MNRFKTFIKERKKTIFFLLLFTMLLYFTPISGDDWGNYIVGKAGIHTSYKTAVGMYYSWEGRFVSRLLLFFLTYHKILWSFLNSLLILMFISICYKFINSDKKKLCYIIPILLLLTVNNNFFTQCYLWIAGNVTYLFPSILSIIVIYNIYKYTNEVGNHCRKSIILKYILLIFFSIIIPMFVENVGCAYVFALFLLIIYYYIINKKISFPLIISLLVSSISLVVMLKSPGSAIRMLSEPDFADMGLFSKIFYNIPNFLRYSFFRNTFLLIGILMIVNKMIRDKYGSSRKVILLQIIFNLIPIITIIEGLIYIFPIDCKLDFGVFNTFNWYYIFYWVIFIFAWFYSIVYFVKNKRECYFLILLLVVAFVSISVMLLTPTWGERVSALFVLINILIVTKLFSDIYKENKLRDKLIFMVFILGIVRMGMYCYINISFDIHRTNTINEQLSSGKEVIVIPNNKLATLWNYTPFTEYHMGTFKKYFEMEEKETEIKIFTIKEYLTYLFSL